MNQISVNVKTMSSTQLGDLLNYDKSTTNRKVKEMFQPEIVGGVITSTIRENGQVTEYHLPEIEAQMFAAKWNIKHLRKVVEFFVSASKEQSEFNIPTTLSGALKLAGELAETVELKEALLLEQAPKIDVYDALADRKGDVSTTIIAKQLGMTAIKLNKALREAGIKWERADLPKAGYSEWFNVVADVRNGHEFTQCLVTPLGQIKITNLLSKEVK
jgi:phage antirepressor YoqD-like protein